MIAPKRPVGGEPEYRGRAGLHSYLVDSGRSALRLILKSGFSARRFLVPDFICDIVPRVLDEFGVDYDTYRVNADLTIDPVSIAGKAYDVLYVVNYFGCRNEYRALIRDDQWIIEDCVFLPFVDPPPDVERWIGFNSLRKVTPLCDGSLIKSTVPLDDALILHGPASFVALKALAKSVKYAYLLDGSGSEDEYLELFRRGEERLDRQTCVHAMSAQSVTGLFDVLRSVETEYRLREQNFRMLDACLREHAVGIAPVYPCFYVLSVAHRDALKQHLFTQGIYLPSHWPNVRGSGNALYRTLLAVPVDSRYEVEDMRRVAEAISAYGRPHPRTVATRN